MRDIAHVGESGVGTPALTTYRCRPAVSGADGEGRRRLQDLPDALDLGVQLAQLPRGELAGNGSTVSVDPAAVAPVVPDAADGAPDEDDGTRAGLPPVQRARSGVPREERRRGWQPTT